MDRANPTKHVTEKLQIKCNTHYMHGTARNAANHSKCSILVRLYSLDKHMPTV